MSLPKKRGISAAVPEKLKIDLKFAQSSRSRFFFRDPIVLFERAANLILRFAVDWNTAQAADLKLVLRRPQAFTCR
jgi:hypothetical protein